MLKEIRIRRRTDLPGDFTILIRADDADRPQEFTAGIDARCAKGKLTVSAAVFVLGIRDISPTDRTHAAPWRIEQYIKMFIRSQGAIERPG